MKSSSISGARNTITPESVSTLNGIFSQLSRISALRMQCNIPAIVKSYDRTSHKATVQPLIKFVYDDISNKEQSLDLPTFDVTVWRMSFGGFLIDMPLFPGDTGWLVASDWNSELAKKNNSYGVSKEISNGTVLYKTENEGPQKPKTFELHEYQNGFFIPDRWGDIDIGDNNKDNIIIKSLNGDTLIGIDPSGNISIQNPNNTARISIQGDLEAEGYVICKNIKSKNALIEGNVKVTGNLNAGGNLNASGDVKASVSEDSSVSLSSHAHLGNLGKETSPPVAGGGYEQGQVFLYPSPCINGWDYSLFIATPEKTYAKPGERVRWTLNSLRESSGSRYGYRIDIIDGKFSYTSSTTTIGYNYDSPTTEYVTVPATCKSSFSISYRATS